ncbi:MAG: protein-L-isoaspartate(D-aspartate) O-methyltransferase [Bacillota bacterium]
MKQLRDQSSQEQMIQRQIVDRGLDDLRVVEAIRQIPRDYFFPQELRDQAHADKAAPIGHGQTISQPYMVALMASRLDAQPGHRILEMGTGSGYQAAILAQLAGEVFTMERVKPLLDEAFERLLSLGIRNIHFRYGDGTLGWPEKAPFDRILITAGAPEVPSRLLLEQLTDGGIAVLPVGKIHTQMLVQIQRHGNDLERTDICPCRFVKLIGQEGWTE